eukprot:gene2268-2665_t
MPSLPNHARGIAALLLVTVVWGTTFPAMKDMTGYLSTNWIVVSRFAMASVLLSPFLFRAAAGGVGLIACQWAKALGLRLI